MRELIVWWQTNRRQVGILAVGVAGNQLMNWAFDYALYPFMIWLLGLVTGGIIMTIFATVTNILLIRFYDWAQQDWLAIELVKSYRDEEERQKHFLTWVLRRSDPIALVILSVWQDPFIATLYMRHGAHQYNGMSRRDWRNFIASTVITNIWWSLLMWGGVQTVIQIIERL